VLRVRVSGGGDGRGYASEVSDTGIGMNGAPVSSGLHAGRRLHPHRRYGGTGSRAPYLKQLVGDSWEERSG